ncbi:hypothetical protein OGAPHI_004324 [Ogataea philodendri]|uniref:Uncharacterized protein n=1 Tax=Ogataea philodendri TaxID=1378263 RepID=A0A9P8P6H1_9ASCO|nr:uncharacterized protein OGAPHI_004324 [Ogataea philodendri]KAH3666135.1 hypothetical protein OGAPHI_004324 [Ogataea philodendri]
MAGDDDAAAKLVGSLESAAVEFWWEMVIINFPETRRFEFERFNSSATVCSLEVSLKLITSPTRILTTPKNPWSFFLNLRWSKIWTIRMEFSVTENLKLWFQCGDKVLLAVSVVCVWAPSTVKTAKGSGE